MYSYKLNTYLKIVFIISIISIISAYFIEYVLGHQPCKLCLIERIPYGLSIFIIILNYTSSKNEKFLILLLALIFSFSLLISIYHLGIEQGIFKESRLCVLKNIDTIITKDELLKQLNEKNVSCKDVTFRIFGFSLTGINILLSLFLTILLSKIFIDYEKFKK